MTKKNETEINSKSQLIDYFEKGNKPPDQWGIGTEHEKFLFRKDNLERLSHNTRPGIGMVMQHMQDSGWHPVTENDKIIALKKDGASITIEPGGQFELSGKNFGNIHQTFGETRKHFEDLSEICKEIDAITLALGFDPIQPRHKMPWMPKERYRIMKAYMPTKGNLGLDMMTRTATIQVNLDYSSEQDMIKKMRVGQALQGIATAIFANSPFTEGRPNGYLSYRAKIWDDTDPDRCGFLPFIFNQDFGFERWTDYLLDVPMYFILRDGQYIDSQKITFREFMNGQHQLRPTMEDWETHVSTVFPDIRLKKFIEMRGADASCVSHIAALSAFWVGLLYDQDALNEAYEITQSWGIEAIRDIREQVPRLALNAKSGSLNARKIAHQMIALSAQGLARRSHELNIEDEGKYLAPIVEIAESGITQAEKHLNKFHKEWNGDVSKLMQCWPQAEPLQ
ncbi:glutamate--cysteine ligase [Marinilabilia rubra]|uniref:Glutamate--cysteine ligase n=1 Tax=Marinilabilia rubra TaxID=2162893 RepID=A0A2U2B7Q2_9BACT|nr:glutamate--cysteine ligase [Marinilabilia rubra]PWD99076.1 glutamate--cysteine ligase [Marinilabilia rubra]